MASKYAYTGPAKSTVVVPKKLLKELTAAAEIGKESASRQMYGDRNVSADIVKACMIEHDGKELALAEVHLVSASRDEPTYVLVIVLDTSVKGQQEDDDEEDEECESLWDDSKRIGVHKFNGEDGLPCQLEDLFDLYLLPELEYGDGSINLYQNFVHPIAYADLPQSGRLHRMDSSNWERDKQERSRFLWRVDDAPLPVNAAGAKPPGKSRSKNKKKGSASESGGALLQTLLTEQRDPASHLSKLPVELIFRIYQSVEIWSEHIISKGVFASVVARVDFPKPTGIYCNMMPIRIGDVSSIPESMRQYAPLLAACPLNRQEYDLFDHKIGYLTIHESTAAVDGASQRRGGVHTETPGRVWLESRRDPALPGDVGGQWEAQLDVPLTIAWGRGNYDDEMRTYYNYCGGLYMASNVADSTRVWNCKVKEPGDVVGPLGDLEHLRWALGEGETLDAGEVVWMTDCTPHESLPLRAGQRRQYFRLVTQDVSVWYADHSTPNPLGVVPPEEVVILHGNKFDESSLKEATKEEREKLKKVVKEKTKTKEKSKEKEKKWKI